MTERHKERPILFNTQMVRAILEDRKTQTRRIVKPVKDRLIGCKLAPNELAGEVNEGDYSNIKYGQPSDRLWVRESGLISINKDAFAYIDHGGKLAPAAPEGSENWCREWKSCPSIHMPRWASRILLEIISVHVERLQDISEDDAISEGCYQDTAMNNMWTADGDTYTANRDGAKRAYQMLWESINGSGSWDANPWVWVIEFKRI